MKRIVHAQITLPTRVSLAELLDLSNPHAGKAVVHARYDDGSAGICLSDFPNEVQFCTDEFVGKTEREVLELFRERDRIYLIG